MNVFLANKASAGSNYRDKSIKVEFFFLFVPPNCSLTVLSYKLICSSVNY